MTASTRTILTANFYLGLTTVITIAVSSIVGFRYSTSVVCELIDSKLVPVIAENVLLRKQIEKDQSIIMANQKQIAENKKISEATYKACNLFIDNFNRANGKDFMRPLDFIIDYIEKDKFEQR